ncbi:DUF6087 family protein [Kitasatospora sp. NPDC101155]|uniref:DUF6087 family protein n=1 Tax=Kitasatospora sp. NPDC101155 TaxID=3364097 RepID=UPI0037FB1F40
MTACRKRALRGFEAVAYSHQCLPRLLSRWDGYQWAPESIAVDSAAARRVPNGIDCDGVVHMSAPQPRRTHVGKHRTT